MVQQSKCSGTPLIPEALGDAPRPRMAIQQVPSTRPCPSQLLALVFKSCKLFVCCLPVLQNILRAASEKFTYFGSLNCCPCVFLDFLVFLPKHVNFLAATCPAFGSSPSQKRNGKFTCLVPWSAAWPPLCVRVSIRSSAWGSVCHEYAPIELVHRS